MNNSSEVVDFSLPASTYAYSVLAFVGLLLNSFVAAIIGFTQAVPGKTPRLFFLNQFICSTACCLVRSFLWLIERPYEVPEDVWGSIYCALIRFPMLYFSLVLAAGYTLILLSIEQYVSVIHPMSHRRFKPALNAFLIALCWVGGFVSEVGVGHLEVGRLGKSCVQIPQGKTWYMAFGLFLFCVGYVFPFVVMVFCYSQIIIFIKRHADNMTRHSGESVIATQQLAARKRIQRDISFSVCIMGVSFLICFGPNMISYTLYALSIIDLDYGGSYYAFTVFFLNMFFVVNPIACIIKMRSFRKEMERIFGCRCRSDSAFAATSPSKVLTNVSTLPVTDAAKF